MVSQPPSPVCLPILPLPGRLASIEDCSSEAEQQQQQQQQLDLGRIGALKQGQLEVESLSPHSPSPLSSPPLPSSSKGRRQHVLSSEGADSPP
ncbi:hypothetical protein CLOP_g16641 [Closterium sp. NIES-67]|nr:hypothetical protein CLOP_g16641 [Closterium sp. NIES-67]